MEASDTLIRSLKRRWPVILLVTILAVLVAYQFTENRTDHYQATSRVLVGPPTNAPQETLRASGLLAQTYAEVAVAEHRLERAAEEAGVQPDLPALREMVTVTANEVTRIVTITVTDEDPAVAATVADSLTAAMLVSGAPPVTPLIEDPGVTLEAGPPAGMLTLVDDATVPPEPIEQPTLLLLILAGAVAATLAGTAAIALEAAPWRRSAANLDGLIHRRFLGRFSLLPSGASARLLQRRSRQQAMREQQLVATKLRHLTAGRPLGSLSVFGGRSDDGSALVAADLAFTFARSDRSVVIVDLTGDREMSRRLRIDKREREVVTVNDVVLELAHVEDAAGNVRVLASDAMRISEQAPQSQHVVDLLGEVADLVIVVAPPMLMEFGTLLVAQRTDGALLVAADDADSIEGAIEAYDLLQGHDVPVLGTVLASRRPAGDGPTAAPTPAPVGTPSGGWNPSSDRASGRVRDR